MGGWRENYFFIKKGSGFSFQRRYDNSVLFYLAVMQLNLSLLMKSFLHRHLDPGMKGERGAKFCSSDSGSISQSQTAEPLKPVACTSSPVTTFGLFALGALSVGALAVGALAIGRLVIGKARIARLDIGTLHVKNCECGCHQGPDGSDSSCCGK